MNKLLNKIINKQSQPIDTNRTVVNNEFILICAVGRSGSTLLQRIINTIPSADIRGENGNIILHLLRAYQSLDSPMLINNNKPYTEYLNHNIKPAWYNNFDKASMQNGIKALIMQYLNKDNSSKILGFKEVRYNTYDDINTLLTFKKIFPSTKIICHIRNDIESQSKSAWFSKDPDPIANIVNRSNILKQFQENNKDVYLSTYEDMFDMKKLRNLFRFLNKESSFDVAKINDVLSVNLG